MRSFEVVYLGLEPFFPPLWRRVRSELVRFGRASHGAANILDVGGRKSHYTVGVPALITVTDIFRRTAVQEQLNLGINGAIARQLFERRSNLRWVVFDDMTRSSFRSSSFDCVVAVEVLEHVERDADFIKEVHRVLKPGGIFMMTTPNGDFVRNTNPDHKRHYKRDELKALLGRDFEDVELEYAIAGGRFRRWALQSWSLERPLVTLKSMLGNLVNSWQSGRECVKNQARGTHHILARARKAG